MLKIILGMCIGLTLILSVGNAAPIAPIIVIPLTGAIGPASADFVDRNILRAQQQGAQLIVLRIDTPGGLDLSMRQIIQTILASKIPVASFVAPGGARAASAGTYILYASHIAAMAPGTNLGAASPVQIGMPEQAPAPPSPVGKDKAASTPGLAADSQSTLHRKQMHDAAAYIRGLAQMRGRNAVWAERAVREAVSLSADEALAQKVIDLTAQDVPELLRKLDGRQLNTADGVHVLHTANAPMMVIELDERTRFLAIITDPSTALILLLIGVYGLIFEFANPGLVLPGVTGAICLLLGLFALQMLPVNYAGLALIFLGIGFLVAEMYLPTFGVVGIGGIVAFGIGAMMLIDTDSPGYGIPVSLILTLAMMTAVFVFFVSGAVLQSRRRPVVSGSEELIESAGVMLGDTDHDGAIYQGWARVHSEHWRVNSTGPLHNGQNIRVIGRTGLVLMVQPEAMLKTGDE